MPGKRVNSTYLLSSRAISSEELSTKLRVVVELLVEVETLAGLLAQPLEEVLADGHLVEVRVVGEQAFFVAARALDEFRADDDVARIVELLTATIGVGETLAEATVDLADDVGLLHGGSRKERDALRLGEAVGDRKLCET
jgi:hypothetical protein